MVYRLDFIYYTIENLRFQNILNLCNMNDGYITALVNVFNDSSYKEIFKYNNKLTLNDVKKSLDIFFNHLNLNHYDYDLKHGILNFNVGNGIRIGYNVKNTNYNDLINKEYLKEWETYGYYWRNE